LLNRADEALLVAESLLGKDSGSVEALLLKAAALEALERFTDVLVVVSELLARDPKSIDALIRRSAALRKLKRFSDGLAVAEEATRIEPASYRAHYTLALALGDAGRLEEELEELDRARELGAPPANIDRNRTIALGRLGRLAEARRLYERAVKENPDDAGLRTNFAHNLLLSGDLERGWEELEHRLEARDFEYRQFARLAPQWKGEDIRDKRLLVYHEQGLGDAIQFVRYVRLLARSKADVCLIVSAPVLLPLFKASLPGVDVTDTLGLRGGFDRQVSLMSLPFVCRTRLETIPRDVPYLRAEPDRIEKWRVRLAGDGIKIGLCWQGNRKQQRDHLRSMRLAALAPLSSVPGVRLLSLQAVDGLDQLEHLPAGMKVETLGLDSLGATDGFAEIAAIMATIDLVISVDSAVAHLAGALAVPVWTAIRAESEWRWLRDREDSPWYPTMRLFRQARLGDWSDVVGGMTREVRNLVAARPPELAARANCEIANSE
jgi:tetratricopeptide (TPR) repeat protein